MADVVPNLNDWKYGDLSVPPSVAETRQLYLLNELPDAIASAAASHSSSVSTSVTGNGVLMTSVPTGRGVQVINVGNVPFKVKIGTGIASDTLFDDILAPGVAAMGSDYYGGEKAFYPTNEQISIWSTNNDHRAKALRYL